MGLHVALVSILIFLDVVSEDDHKKPTGKTLSAGVFSFLAQQQKHNEKSETNACEIEHTSTKCLVCCYHDSEMQRLCMCTCFEKPADIPRTFFVRGVTCCRHLHSLPRIRTNLSGCEQANFPPMFPDIVMNSIFHSGKVFVRQNQMIL